MFDIFDNMNRGYFNTMVFLSFLVMLFLGLESFGGYKSEEELSNPVEKVIYENLILNDDGQKITLKQFMDVSKNEMEEIKKKDLRILKTSQSIESKIIKSYVRYSEKGVVPTTKDVLEKELNSEYKNFTQKATKELPRKRIKKSQYLKVFYIIGCIFSVFYSVVMSEKYLIDSFVSGIVISFIWVFIILSFPILLNARKIGLDSYTKPLFFLSIGISSLLSIYCIKRSKALASIYTLKQKRKMVDNFEKNL